MPSQNEFNTIEKLFRKKYLENEQQMEREHGQILERVKGRIEHIVLNYSKTDGTFDERYQDRIEQEIRALTGWYENEVEEWLTEGLEESARLAIQAEDFAARKHIRGMLDQYEGKPRELLSRAIEDPESPFLLIPRYGEGLPQSVRDTVWNERWFDGNTLSDRIWTQERVLRQNLQGMVEQSINEGRSAVEFAKGVEEYLEKPGTAWTTNIRPSITGKGSVKYNALRLARTETNRAYWKGEQLGHKESIIVKGTKRNLSASHPLDWPPSAAFRGYDEECQYYAEDDHHGLGPGVFPAGEAVEDHVQGLCYLTSVLLEEDELLSTLERKYAA